MCARRAPSAPSGNVRRVDAGQERRSLRPSASQGSTLPSSSILASDAPDSPSTSTTFPDKALQTPARVFALLARGADRVALGIARRHPFLAAQRDDRLAGDVGARDVVLAGEVGEAVVVAVVADRTAGRLLGRLRGRLARRDRR